MYREYVVSKPHQYGECAKQERETGAWIICRRCESVTEEEIEEEERLRTLIEGR